MEAKKLEASLLEDLIKSKPLIISGPCSAESEEQLYQTAKELMSYQINVLRAGIWKPRTKPNSFEGHGEKALPWLKMVKQEFSIPVAVEVANSKQVEEALKYGVDILWIGARTTVSPFTVQEIADALKGVDVPVFVKNPVNPDLELWIGGIERLMHSGVKQIGAIHRGFSTHRKLPYRNEPLWELALSLREKFPKIPLICDPSHICGNRMFLHHIAQRAIDLNYDGLMIESHINPDKALSDAAQQVTPLELGALLNMLSYSTRTTKISVEDEKISQLRQKINSLDEFIIESLAERMKIAESIGEIKKEIHMDVWQNERWNEVLISRMRQGKLKGLDPDFISHLYQLVHQESVRKQEILIESKKKKK
jgi:chorismate mutase